METHMWEREHKQDLLVDGKKYKQDLKQSRES
jgi:hypothetical protein